MTGVQTCALPIYTAEILIDEVWDGFKEYAKSGKVKLKMGKVSKTKIGRASCRERV